MIIGVEAGVMAITDERLKVGVWRVAFNLIKELSKLDTKNEYRLYSFQKIEQSVMDQFGSNVKNVVIRPKIGWSRVQLPLHVKLHPVNVFVGLSQFMPPVSGRKIGVIYDVNFLHDKGLHPESNKKLIQNTQAVVDRSDHIVTISEASKKDIEKYYGKRDITVAYPGVDVVFSTAGKKYIGKHPYFLYVGALKKGKNIPRIIRAFSELEKQSKMKYELLVIGGDYWRDSDIDIEMKKYKGNEIHFLGHVSDEKLAMYYRGARALVSPSIWEGFCLPAAEALACGTPVIGSMTGSMPEVVGKAGILVNPEKTDETVKALENISANESLYKRLKTKAKEQAKKFTWSNFSVSIFKLVTAHQEQ